MKEKNNKRGCAMFGCLPAPGVSFHMFPKDESMRQLWLQLCRRGDTVAKTARVCARHFDEGSYHKNLKAELLGRPYKRMLRSEAVPSLHLPSEESVAEVLSQGASKDKRRTNMVPPSSSLSSG